MLSLCRLCGSRSDPIPLFSDESGVSFVDKVYSTLNIQVCKTDDQQTVCCKCKAKVEDFFDFKIQCSSLERKRAEQDILQIKIKKEVEDPSSSCSAAAGMPGSVLPMMVPTFIMGPNGTFIQMPTMLPVGNPIPISSFSPVKIKKERIDDEKVVTSSKNENVDASSSSSVSSQLKPESVNSESSEELKTVDDIINQVHTDEEEISAPTSNETVTEPEPEPEHQDPTPTPGRSRGVRKRRGSCLPSSSTIKRRRSGRTTHESPQPSKDTPPTRLTRSRTGVQPRKKIVADCDSNDDDFEGDDPDDPEYGSKKIVSPSSSDSSASDSADSDSLKTESEKKKMILISDYLKASKANQEKEIKKSCPHCKITYKHWVSYDDHVKSCAKEDRSKAAPSNATQKEEDDKKETKCIICLEKFIGSKALREHMSTHQAKKGPPYECRICKETFECKGSLICHNALKHRSDIKEPIMKTERKKIYCVECDEKFQNSGDYICHQVLHHKKK